MLIPLFGIEKNQTIDLSGISSQLYKLNSFDLEGVREIDEILKEVSHKLQALSQFKLYLSTRESFINSFDESLNLSEWNFEKVIDEIEGESLKVCENYFLYKEHFYRFYELVSLPSDISPALIQSILDDGSFGVFIGSRLTQPNNLLEKKRRILYSKLLNPFKDPKSDEDFEELEELMGHVNTEVTSLYSIEGGILIKGDSLEDLLARGEDLLERAKKKNIKLTSSLKDPEKIIYKFFPGTKVLIKRPIIVTLQALTNLFLSTKDRLHPSGIEFKSKSLKRVFFNPFNEYSENFNMVISGPSGRGKSVLANKIAFKLLSKGVKVSIIDKGGSFKKLSMYFENHPNFINYLDLAEVKTSERKSAILEHIDNFQRVTDDKLLILDECWEFLKGQEDFLEESFRTFRKMRASALAISQSLEDFEECLLGRVILDNSAHKFFFNQTLRESKYLDREQIQALSKCQGIKGEYSEFLYLSDTKTKRLRYSQTDLERVLFNTEKEENQRFFNFYRENKDFYSFKEIIKRYSR